MPKTIKIFLYLLAFSVLIFIWGLFPNFVLSTYSNGIYPIISTALRFISSIFPFALGDALYVAIIIYIIRLIIKFLWRIKMKGLQKSDKIIVLITIVNVFLIFYISFKLLWGLKLFTTKHN